MGFKRSVQKLRKHYAKKNIEPPIEGKFHKCLNETLNDTKFQLKKGKDTAAQVSLVYQQSTKLNFRAKVQNGYDRQIFRWKRSKRILAMSRRYMYEILQKEPFQSQVGPTPKPLMFNNQF